MIRTYFDEMYDAGGLVRPHYREFARWLAETPDELLAQRRREADLLFHRAGITFTLYGDEQGTERLIPFDTIPRSIPASEWRIVERGCIQRVKALNMFLADLYHEQRIIKAGIIPAEQVLANEQYQLAMQGLDLHRDIYSHISGVDLVRDGDGTYYVLEDNLRTPSGVSYMLEDRKMMMRLFPELFAAQRIAPIDHYPNLLLDTLKSSSPIDNPSVVVLTPGRFNSAFFEHAFLAREMGVELVEGADLFVRDDKVFMRTTDGPKAVDVIYRRLDDAFLDPLAFNPDSMLGVPGLLSSYRSGNVVLANAIGTGVADDKSVYPFVTDMIRFYLGRADPEERSDVPVSQPFRTFPRTGQSSRSGGQGNPRLRRLRNAGRAGGNGGGNRIVPRADQSQAPRVYRSADVVAVDLSDLCRKRHSSTPHRPASVCIVWPRNPGCARRFDPCCPARRLPGGEFLPGWRNQGHLGGRGLKEACHVK